MMGISLGCCVRALRESGRVGLRLELDCDRLLPVIEHMHYCLYTVLFPSFFEIGKF